MKMSVERESFAHARDQRKGGQIHAGAHEEDQILVARFAESGHFVFEGLEQFLVAYLIHVQHTDRHVTVPVASVNRTEPSLADGLSKL